MARVSRRLKPKPAAAPLDRMHALLEQYLVWIGAQNYSADTMTSSRACIGYFLDWCKERSIEDVTEITRPVLERYQRSLYQPRLGNLWVAASVSEPCR